MAKWSTDAARAYSEARQHEARVKSQRRDLYARDRVLTRIKERQAALK